MLQRVEPSSWLIKPKLRPDAQLRLFVFPFAGGAPSAFWSWSAHMPQNIEFALLQLPGRGARLSDPPFLSITNLVKSLVAAIKGEVQKPFVFFGHSMGALVAFEVTRALRKRGILPLHLFVSGNIAPDIPNTNKKMHGLPDGELLEELKKLNGLPAEIFTYAELLDLAVPALRADFTISENYIYSSEPPLECPITAYGGLQDPRVNHQQLEAWRRQTKRDFSIKMFDGDHFYFNDCSLKFLRTFINDLMILL